MKCEEFYGFYYCELCKCMTYHYGVYDNNIGFNGMWTKFICTEHSIKKRDGER